MESFSFKLLAAVALGISLAACSGDSFQRVGHLKDVPGNRIYTIAIPPTASAESVRSHAERLPNTPGRFTAAYFFTEGPGIPADGITLARDVSHANYVLYEMPGIRPWRFSYMHSANGNKAFYDCLQTPSADLCKRELR